MKTIVYIDGYNLYYGRLKDTDHKWLDLLKLFQIISKVQNPSSEITQIKYFTAPVKAKFASRGQEAAQSQSSYHRALKSVHDNTVEIICGYHDASLGTPPRYKNPIDKDDRVDIWKLEEKQTDVNIALHMYKDAIEGKCCQQILVSNDSDLEPPLKLIRENQPEITLGLIIPRHKPTDPKHARAPNQRLSKYTQWTRHHILDEECANSQLADKIPTKRKPIIKPAYW